MGFFLIAVGVVLQVLAIRAGGQKAIWLAGFGIAALALGVAAWRGGD
ncbi:hypothetical protein [Deinococcus rubellus]|uniref:Uncharacterized protein n=1 Tax=Deinococcus rubellus TaxID=1889240 RepID=A0ABY5YGI0_9DEIO|nr:hypothetical protein [Deinococcus rubellus]UWX64185.1 hypothetical protein N0D28_00450 [Deinococcus rubellus]